MSTEDRLRALIGSADSEPHASEAEFSEFVRSAHRPLLVRRTASALGAVAAVGLVGLGALSLTKADETRPIPPAGPESPSPHATRSDHREGEVASAAHELWFVQGGKLIWGGYDVGGSLRSALRSEDPIEQKAAFWLELLLTGPQGPAAEAGDSTAIPKGTKLLGVERQGSTLLVDLSNAFASGEGGVSMRLRVAQVVFTGTQFEGVANVRILLEGEAVDSIGGDGVTIEHPLTRGDFRDVAPELVIIKPKPYEEVSRELVVYGFATTDFDVAYELTDGDGNVLAEDSASLKCGKGTCTSDFSHRIEIDRVGAPREAWLSVMRVTSAGENQYMRYPVTLVPGPA